MAKKSPSALDVDAIAKLMKDMGEHNISGLSIKSPDLEVKLYKSDYKNAYNSAKSSVHSAQVDSKKSEELMLTPLPNAVRNETIDDETSSGEWVTSPMVGSYYQAPGPDDPAFVKVGDRITKDSVVCIIEAMKVMNEVKAGVEGVVKKILLEDGQAVEFGSKLILVEN